MDDAIHSHYSASATASAHNLTSVPPTDYNQFDAAQGSDEWHRRGEAGRQPTRSAARRQKRGRQVVVYDCVRLAVNPRCPEEQRSPSQADTGQLPAEQQSRSQTDCQQSNKALRRPTARRATKPTGRLANTLPRWLHGKAQCYGGWQP